MPFSKDSIRCVGKAILVKPEYGFGWMLFDENRPVMDLEVPDTFPAVVAEIIFEDGEARALLAKLDIEIANCRFYWACFIPRTTMAINLENRSVGCNILLSKSKPYLSETAKYPAPEHVCSDSIIHIRGIGRIERAVDEIS